MIVAFKLNQRKIRYKVDISSLEEMLQNRSMRNMSSFAGRLQRSEIKAKAA